MVGATVAWWTDEVADDPGWVAVDSAMVDSRLPRDVDRPDDPGIGNLAPMSTPDLETDDLVPEAAR